MAPTVDIAPVIDIPIEDAGQRPECCRCFEDFPVAVEPARWTMGEMRSIDKAPDWMLNFLTWLGDRGYLCGNCYFDLLDMRDDLLSQE